MSRREKIIISVMLLTVIYGAYALFFAAPVKKKQSAAEAPTTASLDAFVTQITAGMADRGGSKDDAYILTRAESDWQRDPFLDPRTDLTPEAAASSDVIGREQPDFIYSGYVKMGNRNLAIINGQEYAPGEIIEPGGWTIGQITPAQVVIRMPDGESDIILLLEEMQ